MRVLGRLILLRHGESVSQRLSDADAVPPDRADGLTDRGRTQVRAIGERLAEAYAFERLFASPLARAQQTAEILARRLGVAAETVQELRELALAEDGACTVGELRALHVAAQTAPERLVGRESVAAQRARVAAWCDATLATAVASGDALVVAHGGTIHAILYWLLASGPGAPARCFVALEPARFHAWTLVRAGESATVWRLDAVNATAAPRDDERGPEA